MTEFSWPNTGDPMPEQWQEEINTTAPVEVRQVLLEKFQSEWDGMTMGGLQAYINHILAKKIKPRAAPNPERAAREAKATEYRERHAKWVQDCKDRNAWIEAKRKAWLAGTAQRKEIVDHQDEVRSQWDAYVAQLHADMQMAQGTKAPLMPTKDA